MAAPIQPLLKSYLKFIARCEAKGYVLAAYNCPKCGQLTHTTQPAEQGRSWDSLTACPYCNELYLKTVYAGGRVRIDVIPEDSKEAA